MQTQYEDSYTEDILAITPTLQAFFPPKQRTFWVYRQRTFSRLDNSEKLTAHLDIFIGKMLTVKVDKGLQAVLALYYFAPASFLSMLVANCQRLLDEDKCS